MDAERFDRLVESLTRSGTRRGALRTLSGAILGAAGLGAFAGLDAADKDKRKRRSSSKGKSRKGRNAVRAQAASCCSGGNCTPGPGKNLSKCCYEGQNLAGKNFKGANLGNANFSGATLTNANFSSANLDKTCFVDANLTGARLAGANTGTAIICRTRTSQGINNSGCGNGTNCCQTCVDIGASGCALGGDCCGGAECTGNGDGTCTCPSDAPDICADACVDLQSDKQDCGECGNACPSDESCQGGVCRCGSGPACGNGLTCCGGECVDLLTDLDNCTACGNVCPRPLANADVACGPGVDENGNPGYGCTYLCAANYRDCDGDPLTGCEQQIGDPANPAACRGCPGELGSACPASKPRCCGCDCFETTNSFCSICQPVTSGRLIRRR